MHPRNRYSMAPPDFAALAQQFPELRPFTVGSSIDFARAGATEALTRSLLKADFNLEWVLPAGRLCPSVPSRLDYLLWVEDLLALAPTAAAGGGAAGGAAGGASVSGIDVGTGASAIFALLGARQNGWRFVATDVDDVAIAGARHNVALNGLGGAIDVRQARRVDAAVLSSHWLRAGERFDFCMCNPPFFGSSAEEVALSRGTPRAAAESVVDGGEVAFVGRMVTDSLALGARVHWYTSLLGRKASVKPLLRALAATGIANVRTCEFKQGKTLRWGIAWSFSSDGVELLRAGEGKVLGKKKEAARRDIDTFDVECDGAELMRRAAGYCAGASSAARVVHWAQRSVAAAEITAVAPGAGAVSTTQGTIDPPAKRRRAGSDDAATAAVAAASGVVGAPLFACRLRVAGAVGGTACSVVFDAGSRAEFWTFAGKLKGEVGRTNRRWRRALAK